MPAKRADPIVPPTRRVRIGPPIGDPGPLPPTPQPWLSLPLPVRRSALLPCRCANVAMRWSTSCSHSSLAS